MDRSKDFREMAAALIAGTGYTDTQVPNMKGVTFFGSHGDVGLWGDFLSAVIAIAGDDPARTARITKIMRRVDALAEEKAELVLGRLKNEIKDIGDGEAMFVVSYLYVAHGIAATPDETAPAPVVAAPAVAPAPAGPRRVVVSSAPPSSTGTAQAPPAAAAPPPPPKLPSKPFDGSSWAVPAEGAPVHTDPPPVAVPVASKPAEPVRTVRVIEDAPAGGKQGHGHGGAHAHASKAPVDHKGILKVVFWGMCALILSCSGSIGFLYWLFA